jgi:predicted permease
MAGDIPLTLLYTFLAFLQIYIYFSAGTITGIKKIWTSKSIKAVSEMLVKFFLPLYATLELARMSSWPNVEIMWILIISVIVALTIALAFGFIIQKNFKLDVRFSNTYPYILAMPSLGTLPLVLGRALCYPGGMLEGDPQCSNVLGFMMMNFLIFEMCVFSMGFLFMPRDANFTNVLMEKLSYISHILIGKIFDKNYSVLNIFLRFMKDEKTARQLFDTFDKKYKLEINDQDIVKYKYSENHGIELDFIMDMPHLAHHSKPKHHQDEPIDVIQEEPMVKEEGNSYFNKSLSKSKNSKKGTGHDELSGSFIDNSINFDLNENIPESLQNNAQIGNYATNSEFIRTTDNKLISVDQDKFIKIEISDTGLAHGDIDVIDEQIKLKDEAPKTFEYIDALNCPILTEFIEHEAAHIMSLAEEKKIINEIEMRRKSSIKFFSNDVEIYHQKIFGFVEKHINEEKVEEYNEFKLSVMKNIYGIPPKFFFAKDIAINEDMIKVIDNEWTKFETSMKKLDPEFKLTATEIPFSFKIILAKIHSPPVIGCFLGLLIGESSMREVLFSSNHYVSNIVDGIQIITKTTVPFLYINLGVSILAIKTFNPLNTPLTKKYIILSFIHRNILLPGFGLLYVYLWKTYFGGMVEASKVFRISLFIPFCLPCSTTVVVVVNMIKFFLDETGIIQFCQITTIVINLTILYLIYSVVIG